MNDLHGGYVDYAIGTLAVLSAVVAALTLVTNRRQRRASLDEIKAVEETSRQLVENALSEIKALEEARASTPPSLPKLKVVSHTKTVVSPSTKPGTSDGSQEELTRYLKGLGVEGAHSQLRAVAKAAYGCFDPSSGKDRDVEGLAAFIAENLSTLRVVNNAWKNKALYSAPEMAAAVNAIRDGIPAVDVIALVNRLMNGVFEAGDPLSLLRKQIEKKAPSGTGRTPEERSDRYRLAVTAFRLALFGRKAKTLTKAEKDFDGTLLAARAAG